MTAVFLRMLAVDFDEEADKLEASDKPGLAQPPQS
jgi:hypothetical protein